MAFEIHTAYATRRDSSGTFYNAFAYVERDGIKTGRTTVTRDTKEEALAAVVAASRLPFINDGLAPPNDIAPHGRVVWALGHNWLF